MSYTYEDYKTLYESKRGSVAQALSLIKSGDVILGAYNYNEAVTLFSHLHEIAERVEGVRVFKSRIGVYPFITTPGMDGHINTVFYFCGPAYQQGYKLLNCTYMPANLPDSYDNFNYRSPCNVYLAAVTPMDRDGNFYLGMNQANEFYAVRDAVAQHMTIILEVNPHLTWMNGAVKINIRDVTFLIESENPVHSTPPLPCTEVERQIGRSVAALIPDGSCIQMGIGGIPNALGAFLTDKNDLGLHTEQFTSSMMDLVKAGVITGKRKNLDKGLHVCAFADGVPELYDFLHATPECVLRPGKYVVDPFTIASMENMVSINTLVEIDLTGQVCAESVGPRQISGSGGGFCFAYGAFHSPGGKGILAFPSRTKKGDAKIKAMLTQGAMVTTPRDYVDYIVTEYGVAHLRGTTVRERAAMLIDIAHPDDREALREQARALYYI